MLVISIAASGQYRDCCCNTDVILLSYIIHPRNVFIVDIVIVFSCSGVNKVTFCLDVYSLLGGVCI